MNTIATGVLRPTLTAVLLRLFAVMAAVLSLLLLLVVGSVAVALQWASGFPPVAQVLQMAGLSLLVV